MARPSTWNYSPTKQLRTPRVFAQYLHKIARAVDDGLAEEAKNALDVMLERFCTQPELKTEFTEVETDSDSETEFTFNFNAQPKRTRTALDLEIEDDDPIPTEVLLNAFQTDDEEAVIPAESTAIATTDTSTESQINQIDNLTAADSSCPVGSTLANYETEFNCETDSTLLANQNQELIPTQRSGKAESGTAVSTELGTETQTEPVAGIAAETVTEKALILVESTVDGTTETNVERGVIATTKGLDIESHLFFATEPGETEINSETKLSTTEFSFETKLVEPEQNSVSELTEDFETELVEPEQNFVSKLSEEARVLNQNPISAENKRVEIDPEKPTETEPGVLTQNDSTIDSGKIKTLEPQATTIAVKVQIATPAQTETVPSQPTVNKTRQEQEQEEKRAFATKLFQIWRNLAKQQAENTDDFWAQHVEIETIYRNGFTNLSQWRFLSLLSQVLLDPQVTQEYGYLQAIKQGERNAVTVNNQLFSSLTFFATDSTDAQNTGRQTAPLETIIETEDPAEQLARVRRERDERLANIQQERKRQEVSKQRTQSGFSGILNKLKQRF